MKSNVTLNEFINCGKYADIVQYILGLELFDCRFSSELFTFLRMATKWEGNLKYHQAIFTFKFMEESYEVIGNYSKYGKEGVPVIYWSTLKRVSCKVRV